MLEEMMNNVLDYYRGSGLYEVAVQNQLNYLDGNETKQAIDHLGKSISENTDVANGIRRDIKAAAVGMYNMGQGIRDDIQNMEMGIRNDIRASALMNTNAIQEMAMGIRSDIRESTYAVVASQEMLANTFKQGFNDVKNVLDLGLSLLGNKIDVLSEEVSSKLDQIQDILNNPRLTESRELYRQALISYRKGFYEEALEDCVGAVEKNKTDFISWYLLGLIYLYGAGENGNVIDINKAEASFFNAAKYIKPDIPKSEEAKLLASEIYYNLGLSRLIKSNDYLIENKIDDSNAKLLEAEKASSISYQLSKENLLAAYEQAKELHFLGKSEDSLKILEELIQIEKNFAIKAINDKNFESMWDKIENLVEKLRKKICQTITEKIESTIIFYEKKIKDDEEMARYRLAKHNGKKNISVFLQKRDELQNIYMDIEKKDYFTLLSLHDRLQNDLKDFINFSSELIHDTKEDIKKKKERELQRQEEERRMIEYERERKKYEQKLAEEKRLKEEQRKLEEEKKIEEEKRRKKERRRSIIKSVIIGLLIGFVVGFVPFVSFYFEKNFDWGYYLFEKNTWLCVVLMILGGIYSASWAGERWESCLLSILFFIIGIVIVFFAYAFFEIFMSQGLPIISIGITTVLGGIIGLSSSVFFI
ncbi:MAG: hypothetical protein J6J67_07520 [Treponema sp.]|nr:hypothetical protein [Treponema sp.]